MIRFTRSLSGVIAGAFAGLLLAGCAEGAEAPQDEAPDTSSEVISAEFPGGAAAVSFALTLVSALALFLPCVF